MSTLIYKNSEIEYEKDINNLSFESEESNEDYFSVMYENLDKIYDALK